MEDHRRALNTLRYIHANPKAANMQQGWFFDFSNYGTYERLTQDGLTQWHPAFLQLGKTLDLCVEAYKKFCQQYKPKPKAEPKKHWGRKVLQGIRERVQVKKKKQSPGQKSLWEEREPPTDEIRQVAKRFVLANCYDPKIAGLRFDSVVDEKFTSIGKASSTSQKDPPAGARVSDETIPLDLYTESL
jgi:putative transposase